MSDYEDINEFSIVVFAFPISTCDEQPKMMYLPADHYEKEDRNMKLLHLFEERYIKTIFRYHIHAPLVSIVFEYYKSRRMPFSYSQLLITDLIDRLRPEQLRRKRLARRRRRRKRAREKHLM